MTASQDVFCWPRGKTETKVEENDSFDITFVSESLQISSQIPINWCTTRMICPCEQSLNCNLVEDLREMFK